jgi:hypothetical protein
MQNLIFIFSVNCIKWISYHHAMKCPRVADGGYGHQIWKVVTNVLSMHLWTAANGGDPAWGLDGGGVKQFLILKRVAGTECCVWPPTFADSSE